MRLPMDPRAQIAVWCIQSVGGFGASPPSWMGSAPSEPYGAPRLPWGGGRTCRVSVPCPPPGRRDDDAAHPYPAVAKHCPATTHAGLCSRPRAKPPPAWVPQLQRALSTYQPTHSSASTSQRRSQASRFSGSHVEKATWHISGGEGCRQDPEQAWSEKTSPLGTGESHTPLDHRHWGLCR